MNYWILSPNVTNRKEEEQGWKLAIIKHRVAIMGWGKGDSLGNVFINEVKVGDIVLIAQGANWQKKLFLAGTVSGNAIERHLPFTARSAWQRKLNGCIEGSELNALNLDFDGAAYGDSKQIPAIYKLKPISNAKDKLIAEALSSAILKKNKIEQMEDIIKLLEYKKQIILQGPPGTGKTRLAKLLADQMTRAEKSLTPLEYIIWYVKNHVDTSYSKAIGAQRRSLLKEFADTFPAESTKELTLDSYCRGKGSIESFCYWIELKLRDLGRFSPGQAGNTVYGVYFSTDEGDYICKDSTPKEKLEQIKTALYLLIKSQDYSLAKKIFRQSLILKILHSYYPDEYFPVFSQNHLKTIAKIFEIGVGKFDDDVSLNKHINQHFLDLKSSYSSEISSIDFMRHLYDKFNIKNEEVIKEEIKVVDTIGETVLIQFHPSYSYEDFVRGIISKVNSNSQIEYKVENKTLANFAQKALDNQALKYVIIIDEINRANLSSVLGELIYALEYRYDLEKPADNIVESIYSLKKETGEEADERSLMLPKNLFIIGTMNTADRSVGHIDYAIRRRFAFVDVLSKDLSDELKDKFDKALFSTVSAFFSHDTHLSKEFDPKDVQLGHSYFIDKTTEGGTIAIRLKYEIQPILQEYVKDGILIGDDIVDKINDLLASNA